MSKITRRTVLGGSLAGGAALASPALGQGAVSWTMLTSWPRNLPGPGVTAQRIADQVRLASGGRLEIKLMAAGELVPALQVFDAVGAGAAEMGHTASLFWAGKSPVAPLFTAAPFGLTPLEHIMWIEHGGGQELWDRLYAPFGLKPFMAGNSGFQMGGWYRREIKSLDDMKGIKIRMPGLGGEVVRRLGATPVSIAPSEIVPALQAGTIDAAEFLGPWSDTALGFWQAAPFYYWPGFHEPNGTSEGLVNLQAWSALPDDLKAVVAHVLSAENIRGLAEAEWQNAVYLDVLQAEKGVTLKAYPADILSAARTAADEVFDDLAGKSAIAGKIVASYREARARIQPWSKVSQAALLAARE
jgi:TRAP-type mannitol/chloroaromatic compound transport system substrate-binding protein